MITASNPIKDGPSHNVTIGSHNVAGFKGSILEGFAMVEVAPGLIISMVSPPHPTYYWAVCVGDSYYELSADHNTIIVQTKIGRQTDKIGNTGSLKCSLEPPNIMAKLPVKAGGCHYDEI
jgi:hypothetical protein